MVSPIAIVPPSGVCSPATQSSRVVLPAPEAPNRMVKPAATKSSTSSVNWESLSPRKRFCTRTVSCSPGGDVAASPEVVKTVEKRGLKYHRGRVGEALREEIETLVEGELADP